MHNRVTVKFRALANPNVDTCVLELSSDMTHDEVVAKLAAHVEHDAAKIRLVQHSPMYNKPRTQPIKSGPKVTLTDMLANFTGLTKKGIDILYYEKLDIPLIELENNKLLKIDWYNSQVQLESTHQILMPKTSHFTDVMAKLKEILGPLKGTGEIRFLEVQNNKIYRHVKPDERTTGFTEYVPLRAEEIPEEELKKDKLSKTIQVIHVYRDPPSIQTFGNPFNLAVPRNEKFGETKKRIQDKLAIPEEEFNTWKFCIVPWIGKPTPVDDDDCIAAKIEASECLGLEHKPPRRAANPNRRKEEQLIIKG